MESTLEEIQPKQTTLFGVMEKTQNHVMQDTNQDEAPSVNGSPAISKPLSFPAGPLGETVIMSQPLGRTFQEDLDGQLRQMRERHPEGLLVGLMIGTRGPEVTLTEPNVLRVQVAPL